MISLKNVKKSFADNDLFDNVNLTFNENEKVAIVGKNGSGKSTLLSIIKNEDNASFGEVIYAKHSIEFLDQEKQLANFETIDDVISSLMSQFKNITNEITKIVNDPDFASNQKLIEYYGVLENKFISLGGYEVESEIKRIFAQFNFKEDSYSTKIDTLSGGQKTRLALASILLKKPDFLILDEPTNHLDIDTIEWLEDYLRNKAKGVIIVSHDRFFVNRVCSKIVELENKTVTVYNTNYDNYLNEKKLRYEHQLANYYTQQKEIEKFQEFIIKNRSKPSKIGQVNDRKKKLEHLELIEKPFNDYETVNFKIDSLHHKKNAYIEFIDADIGYEKILINKLNVTVNAGEKIGLVGENASGKSTIVKTILKQNSVLNGSINVHPKIKIGYFDQNFLEINEELTVYEEIELLMEEQNQTQIRKHLSQFLFKGSDVFKKVAMLSGGEKVRLIFAKLVLENYDLLIMDEPTNHLDLRTKEELEHVLQAYNGTLILISHDRYFINQIVERIWSIEHFDLINYIGKYEEYIELKKNSVNNRIKIKKEVKKSKKSNVNNQMKIMKQLTSLEDDLAVLVDKTSQEEYYNNFQKMNELNENITNITKDIERLYEELQ